MLTNLCRLILAMLTYVKLILAMLTYAILILDMLNYANPSYVKLILCELYLRL